MATTSATVTASGFRSSGHRQAPPLDALHAHGRLRGPRGPDDRPRRGLPTSGTSTASATWTGSPRSSASTPVTAARSSARRPPRRSRSSTSTRLWSYAHPRAIELAARIAALAPADLNRVFFTYGGSEAVESAMKLARAYHQRTGDGRGRPSSSPARSPTTAPLSARWPPPASPRSATSSSRWSPAGSTCRTPTATTGPRAATRSGRPTQIEEKIISRAPRPSPR